MGLDDSLKQARLHHFWVARRADHDLIPGIAGLLQPSRGSRQPWRRLALFRLMYLACKDAPELVSFSALHCLGHLKVPSMLAISRLAQDLHLHRAGVTYNCVDRKA